MKLGLVLCALAFASCAGGADIDLKTAQVVCCDTNSPACRLAAEELEKHLALVAGRRAPAADGFVFAVGEKPADEPAPQAWDSKGRVRGDRISFWGEEGQHGLETSKGPLFAVYEFLNRALGVLWTFPGDDGIVAPPRQTLAVTEGERWSYRPLFEVCYFPNLRLWRGYNRRFKGPKAFRLTQRQINAKWDDLDRWYLRRRLASLDRQASGHNFTDWQAKYLKDHPDWFAYLEHPDLVRDGKPGRGAKDSQASRVHGCYSNPDLAQAIVDDWVAKGMPKRMNICFNDGGYCFCRCEKCKALDVLGPGEKMPAHLTDRVVHLYNAVSPLAIAKRPDVDIMAYLYFNYRFPPRRERLLNGDHFTFSYVPGLGDDVAADIDAWRAAGLKKFFSRPNYMCAGAAFPRGFEKWLYDDFQALYKRGSVGYSYDGAPMGVTHLEYYVITELCQHPDRGFDEIVDEFCSQYGPAARAARTYFDRIRARSGRILDTLGRSKEAKNRLDDSEIAGFAVRGHTKSDLEADLAVLQQVDKTVLSARAARRFDYLLAQARNALLTFAFFETASGRDEPAFAEAAKTLYDYRLANYVLLSQDGAGWFGHRSGEVPLWARTVYMELNGDRYAEQNSAGLNE